MPDRRPRHPTPSQWALCAMLLIAAAGCSRQQAGPGKVVGPQTIDVISAEAKIQPLGVEIEAVGTARANESVEVTSKASNTITAIRFEEGDRVRKGDVLVELDGAEARASLAEAEAALAESQNNFKRSRDLYTQQALSVSQLDLIEATLKGNQARVDVAKARLADTIIRASFDGKTGFRRVSVGSLVSPGTVITTLDDTSVIKLDFTVAETYLYALAKGLPVTATTAGLPGREFNGKVSQIDSRVDPVSRSIAVRAELPNAKGELRPGMFMTVKLQGEVSPALLVSESAIVPEQGRVFVFVVENGEATRREVKLGKRRPGVVEIVEGLKEHERVVIEGTQNLRDGGPVREQGQQAQAEQKTSS
ncbi:MexH family multidrug efflux RND transporter periplasmic adaptor subunit [Steroidobacter agaridevorans]|uniref:MexH family multidrug efflux RND transporter periplasmic adaptor subunit n=1 Tax=Steroidobacter agaridevorans TaxID=2695856 RepID=A0A829YFI3_9GAMM|nr:efflux RND transporter periplasmic adaptor subunit [Steroidobacter agaridevorans]GFE81673.1 MexH family multidrug efflux RND transporter periplasmic adaptor subunit [Steroidobacter agaridevorans]GFE90417.1 MexH family multidrug efflux RND transporter periplasmic adaptor subunit [Steroidobacter agaridevorans]